MHKIQLVKFTISEQQFKRLPQNVRTWLCIFGLAANEINILRKLIISSSKTKTTDPVETSALNCQSFFLYKLLAGKLHEAWQVAERLFFGTKLSKDVAPKFSDETKDAQRCVKRYFKYNDNKISKIRNKINFHFDLSVGESLAPIENDGYTTYVAEKANTFHASSALLAQKYVADILSNNTDESPYHELRPEHAATIEEFVEEVGEISEKMLDFLDGSLVSCLDCYLETKDFKNVEVAIDEKYNLQTFELPFFYQIE